MNVWAACSCVEGCGVLEWRVHICVFVWIYVHVWLARTWLVGAFLCRVSELFVFGLCVVHSVCGVFVFLVGVWAC